MRFKLVIGCRVQGNALDSAQVLLCFCKYGWGMSLSVRGHEQLSGSPMRSPPEQTARYLSPLSKVTVHRSKHALFLRVVRLHTAYDSSYPLSSSCM